MEEKTIVYDNVEHGDWVICGCCGKRMLVPCGAEICPECGCSGSMNWVDEEIQEADMDSVGEIEYTERQLKLEDYLEPDTLSIEYPEYYKKLRMENNLQDVESPESDVKDYANQYGYAALGYAIVRMINEGCFEPDWNFASTLWDYDGVAAAKDAKEKEC